MNFWDKITGKDLTKRWKLLDARAGELPQDHQAAYVQIAAELWQRNGFSGRNTLSLLEGVMELLEDAKANERSALEVLGNDLSGFCAELAQGVHEPSYRDRWRDHLNKTVLRKLGR